MHILVTGGAGFVGSHLVDWLVEQGHQVRVLDNFYTGQRGRLTPHGAAVTLHEADIADYTAVVRACTGCALVFHLAAMVSVVQSVAQPLAAQQINATGSLHVLEAARQAGVQRVVQMSSSAVYGENPALPLHEDAPPQPWSPYALTKLAAEHAGQLYARTYGLEVVALRGFNIYGPRQDPGSPYAAVVPRFMARLSNHQQPTIYGDGEQSRDFIYVDDVVHALWLAATTPNLSGRVFNVARGQPCTINELVQLVGAALNTGVAPRYDEARPGEVRHSYAAVEALAAATGFRAETALPEGLVRTLAAWKG